MKRVLAKVEAAEAVAATAAVGGTAVGVGETAVEAAVAAIVVSN
jgi:hypothetical protein